MKFDLRNLVRLYGRWVFMVMIIIALSVTSTVIADEPNFDRERYLLLDSRIIDSTENVQLTVGVVHKDENNPLFKEDKPWEPRFDNPYCSILYDEEENIYKCWYSIFIKSGPHGDFPGEGISSEKRSRLKWTEGDRDYGVCYATSKDGIHWEKPELGLIEFNGKKNNNTKVLHHGYSQSSLGKRSPGP